MSFLKISSLKTHVLVGSTSYPIFIAFCSAHDLLKVAETPQFQRDTMQKDLAASVLLPNMDDWQRPLDETRVAQIAMVFKGQELMPNPVLLSENGNLTTKPIRIKQQLAANSIPTNIWDIEIDIASQGGKALWILDGQHRIHGLDKSGVQAGNDIPVVLLLNDNHVYTGSILAKIFAQVTTGAKKLDDLHNEWLTYAFRLGPYADAQNGSLAQQRSMEAVAELCARPQFTVANTVIPNVFCNNIRFNEFNPPGDFPFGYDCTELKSLVHKYYYNRTSQHAHLQPLILASEICRAVQALDKEILAPQSDSVFLGDSEHAQKIMKDAYIVAVLAKLLISPAPIDWKQLLQALQFRNTSWNFKSWARTLSAQKNASSRAVAYRVLTAAFQSESLYGGYNLADYLRGNAAQLDLVFSVPNGQGETNAMVVPVLRGSTLSPTVEDRLHLRIKNVSPNIAGVKIFDGNARPGKPVIYPELLSKSGMVLSMEKHSTPLKLEIMMEFYGGTEVLSEVIVSW